MKTFLSISLIKLLLISSLSFTSLFDQYIEHVTALQEGNTFILKASRKFKGADVEVLSSSGYLVTSQKLNRHKLIIDFSKVQKGTYRIKVKKGSSEQEFRYIKD